MELFIIAASVVPVIGSWPDSSHGHPPPSRSLRNLVYRWRPRTEEESVRIEHSREAATAVMMCGARPHGGREKNEERNGD